VSYFEVAGHRSMALDERRNLAYDEALRQAVGPESVVLDLGAGLGIHGLMAARLGARRVYLVEPEDVVFLAGEIAEANGYGSVVRCLQGRVEDVELPEQVDIIVSALTGNFLVTEDLLPSLFFARDGVLKPGGMLIPSAARMEAAPVSAAKFHAKEIGGWSAAQQGIDLSPARSYAANTLFYRPEDAGEMVCLAEPQVLQTVDFQRDAYAGVHTNTTYPIARSGICHGWLGWFSMKLGDAWVSTSPFEPPMHWTPAFLPVDPPIALEAGQRVSLTLDREPFGDWTWRIDAGQTRQEHSTFFATPMSATTLQKASLAYLPRLSRDGAALCDVFSKFDGATPVSAIVDWVMSSYPERYASRDEAIAFVQRLVKRYANSSTRP
jgi:SAM-dependent methyltransferase